MAKTINVAVITNHEGAHLDSYFTGLAATQEAAEVTLADPSGKTVERAKKHLGNKLKEVYKSATELLTKEQPPLALVSLPGDQAPAAIKEALEAGCHVLPEKPACTRLEDFAKLVELAQRKHRQIMLALANRTNTDTKEAQRLIRDGQFGKFFGAEVHIIADQTRLRRPGYGKSWNAQKARAGGGHLIWLGIHWLDLVMYLTGHKIKDVAGFTTVIGGQPNDVEDSAALVLRFDNGTLGTMNSGYYLDQGYHTNIMLWYENGWVRLSRETDLDWYNSREKDAKIHHVDTSKGERGYTPFVRSAVRFVAGLEEAPITSEDGLQVLRTIFTLYQAAQAGKTQAVL
jgi:predicted dehydrogenase